MRCFRCKASKRQKYLAGDQSEALPEDRLKANINKRKKKVKI
jgi:hypothetical protein